MSKHNMTDFVYQYLETALWASNNWDDMVNDNPEPFDKDYSPEDFSLDAIKKANDDCDKFMQLVEDAGIDLDALNDDDTQHAHDFFLTRNHHGVGFLDRGYPSDIGNKLKVIAQSFREVSLFVNDNGQIFFE